MKDFYVYFLSSQNNKALYVGITNDLERRIWEHKTGTIKGFSEKYKTKNLVYFEMAPNPDDAIRREKQIKNWRRSKKDYLVNQMNPEWRDLSEDWHEKDPSASLGMTGERV